MGTGRYVNQALKEKDAHIFTWRIRDTQGLFIQ